MKLFSHANRERDDTTRRIYARFEILHTCIDFVAALCFLAGSILFFWKSLETPAVWLFVVGSVFFAVKPTLRLMRELKLAAIGDEKDLAERYRA